MKMNTLDALRTVCERVGAGGAAEAMLEGFRPRAYTEQLPGGVSIAAAGCVPILHMRHFAGQKVYSEDLVADIVGRHKQ